MPQTPSGLRTFAVMCSPGMRGHRKFIICLFGYVLHMWMSKVNQGGRSAQATPQLQLHGWITPKRGNRQLAHAWMPKVKEGGNGRRSAPAAPQPSCLTTSKPTVKTPKAPTHLDVKGEGGREQGAQRPVDGAAGQHLPRRRRPLCAAERARHLADGVLPLPEVHLRKCCSRRSSGIERTISQRWGG